MPSYAGAVLGTRAGRTYRGLIAALVATFVASVSHSVADGEPAAMIGIVLALVFAAPVCIALAGRTLSWLRLSIAVAASQFAFHGLLLVGVGSGSGSHPLGTHLHGADLAGALGTTALHAGAGHPDHAQPAMWIAHAIAAVLTVLALGRGERAIRALLELTGWNLVAVLLTGEPPAGAPGAAGDAHRSAGLPLPLHADRRAEEGSAARGLTPFSRICADPPGHRPECASARAPPRPQKELPCETPPSPARSSASLPAPCSPSSPHSRPRPT